MLDSFYRDASKSWIFVLKTVPLCQCRIYNDCYFNFNPCGERVHCFFYLFMHIIKLSLCLCVCEYVLWRENITTYSCQILYEDSKTPECVHLRHRFLNLLEVYIFKFFFKKFFLFLYKIFFFFTLTFEGMLRFLQTFLCWKNHFFT